MLLLSVALLAPANAEAPELTPEIQVRPRLETHSGKDGAEGGEVLFVSQRSRLGATLESDNISARVVVQDVRTFGEESNTLTDFNADTLDVHFAYLDWKIVDGVKLRAGRQEVAIHEHRLIGTVGWTQQARAFDGALASAGNDTLSLDAGGFITAESDSPVNENDAGLLLARAGWSGEGGLVDALYVLDVDAATTMTRNTAGVYAKGGSGILSGRVEGYAQMGSAGDASIFAYMAGVQGTLAPEVGWSPKVTLWYDLLSGDEDPADAEITAFNTLFATNHKFYGHADIAVFGLGGPGDGRGLQDIALKLQVSPTDTVSVNVDGHAFLAAAPQGGEAAMLAQEVDAWVKLPVGGPHRPSGL